MTHQKLRGALIGCGYFGQIQLEAWRRMESAEIVAACDVAVAKAAAAAPLAFTDAEALLDSGTFDFIDIATRPDTHLELVRLCVERRIPVILQKPMAPDLDSAKAIVELAAQSEVPVMLHENWRWQPWHREMKRRLEAGDIGAPFGYHFTMMSNDGLGPTPYPSQPYFASMPRLLMFESLIHPVDVSRYYFGDIEKVYAVARKRNPIIAGEDRAVILISHRQSVDGIVEGQRYLQPEPPGPAMGHSMIEGEEGRMVSLASGDVLVNGKLAWLNEQWDGYKGDSVKATQEHFIECLRSGVEFETSARRYLGSFAAIEAAYLSVRQQRAIQL